MVEPHKPTKDVQRGRCEERWQPTQRGPRCTVLAEAVEAFQIIEEPMGRIVEWKVHDQLPIRTVVGEGGVGEVGGITDVTEHEQ